MTKPIAILLFAVILTFRPSVTLSAQAQQDTARAQQDAAQEEQDSWDVEQSLGPTVPLSFETDEGTWMNVDLDPDGMAAHPEQGGGMNGCEHESSRMIRSSGSRWAVPVRPGWEESSTADSERRPRA